MGFREIAMIVVAIILGGILTLSIAPSMSASGNAVRAGVLNGEVETVAASAKMWMANNTAGTFNGISATAIGTGVPLTVTGGKYVSKAAGGVTYEVAAATSTSTDDSFTITVEGLSSVSGAEAAMKSMLIGKYDTGNVTDTVATDGILVVKIRG